jgi:hypothetical protein
MYSKAVAAVARALMSPSLAVAQCCQNMRNGYKLGIVGIGSCLIFAPSWAGEPDGDGNDTLSAPSSQQTGPAEANTVAGCVRSDVAAVIDNVTGDSNAAGPSAGGEGVGVEAAEPPERKRARAGAPTYSTLPLPHFCCPFLPAS